MFEHVSTYLLSPHGRLFPVSIASTCVARARERWKRGGGVVVVYVVIWPEMPEPKCLTSLRASAHLHTHTHIHSFNDIVWLSRLNKTNDTYTLP